MKKETAIKRIESKINKINHDIETGLIGRDGKLNLEGKKKAYEEDIELIRKIKWIIQKSIW